MNELEFEEKWEELDYKILMVSKKSGMISTVPDWGLERLLNLGDWLDSHYKKEETLTVGELIELLSLYDRNLPVYVYSVGFTSKDSFKKPIEFGNDSVDFFEGEVRISTSNMG